MSDVARMERIEAGMMDPQMDGGFVETTIEKRAWMCCGCGLVWSRYGQAADCEGRGHTATFQVRYVTGPIVNGVPKAERWYPRAAIRREPLDVVADALLDEYDRLAIGRGRR
jgi:hypothetical protein